MNEKGTSMNATELEKLIRRIAEMTTLVYSREKNLGLEEMRLMPPANRTDIDALSKSRPFPLPPSYREFLELHDGCLDFWAEFALVGTAGKPREIVEAEIEDARVEQRGDVVNADGTIIPESIARFESVKNAFGEAEYYLPAHTVFGATGAGGFLLFDEKITSSPGEYQVVDYTYSSRARARYPDFTAFLKGTASELETRIRERGYAPSGKAPAATKTRGGTRRG